MDIQAMISNNSYGIADIIHLFQEELAHNLVGIYIHGSLAMGGFHPHHSDIDLLVIVQQKVSRSAKLHIANRLLKLEEHLISSSGLEISILLENDVKQFVYPTPFEFHYSAYHREKYRTDKQYVCEGAEDPDLAAHIFVTYDRGITLYGKEIKEVFVPIDPQWYIRSILADIEHVADDIVTSPVYFTLNLCRILFFLSENVISSKQEGGEWGLTHVPATYSKLIQTCLDQYQGVSDSTALEIIQLQEFACYMKGEIQKQVNSSNEKIDDLKSFL
ncbi:putative nucleotidyltransferase [Paenibacillus sp. SORGH_AS306]|uniref:aminoglycoside adenylyltransferase domain-containing protein n=1 Tax=unclassified Paenibacillus TaxID=185978 RepID=UPI002780BEF1|nr:MULTISPECIES: aminoglycoside adenylyltransferase domain-containing protein [unclassified Paenibacillus]MDQ1235112.1 putative nucleotidyltransferase [Paenibacillus sp. SORGH_AS_0306]MDR6112159.1 putative nucleotidyltransferase [Paenibacillus sp. SORGH_AS_0338]